MEHDKINITVTEDGDTITGVTMHVFTAVEALDALNALRQAQQEKFEGFVNQLYVSANTWWENRICAAKLFEYWSGIDTHPVSVFTSPLPKGEKTMSAQEAATLIMAMYQRSLALKVQLRSLSPSGINTLGDWMRFSHLTSSVGCDITPEFINHLSAERISALLSLTLVKEADLFLLNQIH